MVTFALARNPSSVTKYKATIGDHSCEVAAGRSPLSCVLTGLSGGSLYTVQAVACLRNGDCSDPTHGRGYTLPEGRSNLKHIPEIWKNVTKHKFIFSTKYCFSDQAFNERI